MNFIRIIWYKKDKANVNNINIEIRKDFQYRPRDNSIGVKSYTSKKCSDVIPSLHEVGHYISLNKNTENLIVFKKSQYLIAINRLIIIPVYIISLLIVSLSNYEIVFLDNILIKNIMLSYFIFASLLKLFIGLPNEIFASLNALRFVKKRYNKEIIILSKNMYFWSFMGQFLFFLLAVFVVYNIQHFIV